MSSVISIINYEHITIKKPHIFFIRKMMEILCNECNQKKEIKWHKALSKCKKIKCDDCKIVIKKLKNNNQKKCSDCNNIFDLSNFAVNSSNGKKIPYSICKSCMKKKENWKKEDKLIQKIRAHNHYIKNKKEKQRKARIRDRERCATDSNYKLQKTLRTRIVLTIKKMNACKSATKLLKEIVGCSIDELRLHLENQFKDDMSWENHGPSRIGEKNWQIDHIKPCSSFNLLDLEEQKKCFHYTNLQPLWWWENLSKKNNIL